MLNVLCNMFVFLLKLGVGILICDVLKKTGLIRLKLCFFIMCCMRIELIMLC